MQKHQSLVKKIVLLAYKFPPYEGVGARRWAKFVKYFAKKGVEIHVVTTNWNSKGKLGWANDINSKNIIVHAFPNPLYELQRIFPFASSILDKCARIFRYRIFKHSDEAHFWTILHKEKIKKIIENNNIRYIIATGPPYSVNCLASKLKTEIKNSKVIQDIRDPWTDDLYFKLSDQQADIQKREEIDMLNNSDAVVAVTNSLLDLYKKKCTNAAVKFKTIYNGYDPDDASVKAHQPHTSGSEEQCINISYFGSVGAGRENQLLNFAKLLSNEGEVIYSKFRIAVFGSVDHQVDKIIKELPVGKIFNFHPFIATGEAQAFMNNANMHMSINAEIYSYAFGSKVFDAFLYKKKVLLISPEGELYSLIKDNALGYTTNGSEDQTKNVIRQMVADFETQKMNEENKYFNYGQFSIENLSDEYINFLNKI